MQLVRRQKKRKVRWAAVPQRARTISRILQQAQAARETAPHMLALHRFAVRHRQVSSASWIGF